MRSASSKLSVGRKAIEKDDLSLLSRHDGEGTKKVQQQRSSSPSRNFPTPSGHAAGQSGLSAKREKYHHSLKELAIRERKIHIVGSPELTIEGTPVYLDVEGLPDRDFYYLIGVRIENGDGDRSTQPVG